MIIIRNDGVQVNLAWWDQIVRDESTVLVESTVNGIYHKLPLAIFEEPIVADGLMIDLQQAVRMENPKAKALVFDLRKWSRDTGHQVILASS
jgi:hypothetical protein